MIRSKQGPDFHSVEFSNGDTHIVYVLSYLDGVLLSDTDACQDSAARRCIGALMARVDIALRGYFHPAAVQQHPWNFDTCLRLRHLVAHIDDSADRTLVDEFFESMATTTLPRLRALRHQVIHQDAHTDNVLVDPDDTTTVTGLIDFGDMLYGTLVAEVAVACDIIPYGAADIVTPASELVASFDAVLALEEDEVDLVFDLVCARNALTATIAAARRALTPEQPAHIGSPGLYVDHLRELQAVGRTKFIRQLRSACRFPAYCPRTRRRCARC